MDLHLSRTEGKILNGLNEYFMPCRGGSRISCLGVGGGRTFLSIFLLGCLEPIKLKDNERLLSILHPPNISDSLPHFAAH